MTSKAGLPLSRHISSPFTIWLMSLAAGASVFALAAFFQWLIYDDWMHDAGPLRLIGSLVAGALMCFGVFRWQVAVRRRRMEIVGRFETIRWMNDRIRNALQAIECVTFAANPEATEQVRTAVDAIEAVLHEVLAETGPAETGPAEPRPRVGNEAESDSVSV